MQADPGRVCRDNSKAKIMTMIKTKHILNSMHAPLRKVARLWCASGACVAAALSLSSCIDEEEFADDDAPQHGADAKLDVGKVAQGVALTGGAEEGGGADFSGDDGGEDGPPGHAAVAEGVAFQGVLLAANVETDAENGAEVGENDEQIEGHGGRRAGVRRRIG